MIMIKSLDVVWGLKMLLVLLWCFSGFVLVGLGFFVDKLGLWNILYAACLLIFITTAKSTSNWSSSIINQ